MCNFLFYLYIVDETKNLPLDNYNFATCISSRIMKCNRVVANTFRKHISPFGVTSSQLGILFFISKSQGVNQKKIADFLILEKSTVNRNLTRLIEKRYLRYTDGAILNLTPEGYSFVEKVAPHWCEAMNEIKEVLKSEGEEALNMLVSKLIS